MSLTFSVNVAEPGHSAWSFLTVDQLLLLLVHVVNLVPRRILLYDLLEIALLALGHVLLLDLAVNSFNIFNVRGCGLCQRIEGIKLCWRDELRFSFGVQKMAISKELGVLVHALGFVCRWRGLRIRLHIAEKVLSRVLRIVLAASPHIAQVLHTVHVLLAAQLGLRTIIILWPLLMPVLFGIPHVGLFCLAEPVLGAPVMRRIVVLWKCYF